MLFNKLIGATVEAVISSSARSLEAGTKSLAQCEQSPGTVFVKANAKVTGDQLGAFVSEFIGRLPIDRVDAKPFLPIFPTPDGVCV